MQSSVTPIQFSDLGWFVVTCSCRFLCLWGSFVMCLYKESCASTVDSTGIVLLPFACFRRTDRQAENRKVTVEPASCAACARLVKTCLQRQLKIDQHTMVSTPGFTVVPRLLRISLLDRFMRPWDSICPRYGE